MPELPDVTVYVEHLERRLVGDRLIAARVSSPHLLRTAEPPLEAVIDHRVVGVGRIGKRIVIGFEDELFLVLHLMIAGRLHWLEPGAQPKSRAVIAWFGFTRGTLSWTEAGTKRRTSLHVVQGAGTLADFDPGGLEPIEASFEDFRDRLLEENHTLKRALTDPRLFSGIGNAYSDEILHRARLSPLQWTTRLDEEEIRRLHAAARDVLVEWTIRLRRETGDAFPEKVTAFRKGMAVHGRFREPCPVCGAPVQRIVHAENETNYCARCQTEGRVLADRALSRLLRKDWPRTLEEWER